LAVLPDLSLVIPIVRRLQFSPQVFVLLAFAALLAAPLTAPGYFVLAHDARHSVYFMQMFDAAFREGAIFPRWAEDMVFGYGYPLWIILAPLPYYGAEFFHLLGLDIPASIKAIEAVGWFASGLGMYWFASRVMDRNAGLVAGIAYLFVPYHIVDLYVRGAMPEFLAFVFPPFILLGIYQIYATRRLFYVPITAFAYGGMLLTHVQMSVLFSPVIAGYVLVLWMEERRRKDGGRRTKDDSLVRNTNRKDALRRTTEDGGRRTSEWLISNFGSPFVLSFAAILWGVGIAAVFFLPVVFEQRYLTSDPLIGGFFNFRLHFVNPSQLFSPFWGYGYAGTNGNDLFSLQLGIMPVFFGTLALLTLTRREAVSYQVAYFGIVTLCAVFAMLALSAPLWELAAPIVAFTQFPWRVLFVSAFALAFLAGASVRVFEPSGQFRGALMAALLLALAMLPFARPLYSEAVFTANTLMDFQVKDRELLGDTMWVEERPESSPLVEQYRAGSVTSIAAVVEGEATVEFVENRALSDTVRVDAATPARVQFYTRYFPGWWATIDGAPVTVEPSGEQGLVTVSVPPGTHTVSTHWGTTLPRVVGGVVSLVAAIGALVVIWRTR
jgi:hypothetical protein